MSRSPSTSRPLGGRAWMRRGARPAFRDSWANSSRAACWRRRDERTLETAWQVEDRFGLSFWDALIVAAARTSGCDHLLTEDLQDGQELDGVVVVDPFANDPTALS